MLAPPGSRGHPREAFSNLERGRMLLRSIR